VRSLACYSRRGNKVGRAASRGRRLDGEAARRRDGKYCGTNLLTFENLREVRLKVCVKSLLKVCNKVCVNVCIKVCVKRLCENGLATGMVPSQKFALKGYVRTDWPLKWYRTA
jgi:hypothetical protein